MSPNFNVSPDFRNPLIPIALFSFQSFGNRFKGSSCRLLFGLVHSPSGASATHSWGYTSLNAPVPELSKVQNVMEKVSEIKKSIETHLQQFLQQIRFNVFFSNRSLTPNEIQGTIVNDRIHSLSSESKWIRCHC